MTDLKKPRPLKPGEPLDNAVYCATCKFFEQELIGNKKGSCMGHAVLDSSHPLECPYFHNDLRLISVMIFLNNGISVYHKAIVQDISSEIDPQLLSSFLNAINLFGSQVTKEDLSLIQFQKMNILVCRGQYSYGALLIKGEVDDLCKDAFANFVTKVEDNFTEYFEGAYTGQLLPEDKCDKLAFSSMRKYAIGKLFAISPELMEKTCFFKCAHSH